MDSAVQEAQENLSKLVSSLKEVQALQAQTREQLDAVGKQMAQAPKVSGLPTGQCVHWIQTNECKADGPLQFIGGTKSITSAADCAAAGGVDYNYCPETGKHYCCGVQSGRGYSPCDGTDGACPSNSSLQNCVCSSSSQGQQTIRQCSEQLQSGWSGYCVCGTGSDQFKVGFDCNGGQEGKTCEDVCRETGASAYGPMPASDAAACLSGGGVFVGQGNAAGFLAADPGAHLPGCPSDAKCCVPLTGTINIADAGSLFVSGATGSLSKVNGEYTPYGSGIQGVPKFANATNSVWIQASGPNGKWYFGSATGNLVVASGAFATNPQRLPVGGSAEPWQNVSGGDSAEASGIRIAADSKTDTAGMLQQQSKLQAQLQDLEEVEETLISEIQEQKLATVDAESAEAQTLRAEARASRVIRAETEAQRRRLRRERGMEARDNTLIVAANSEALKSQAYTRVTLTSIIVVLGLFAVYYLNTRGLIGRDMAFILAVAAGGAGLIAISVMLSSINARNPRDFTKFYFSPPSGLSTGVPGAFSPAKAADGNNLQSCRRALRTAKAL
jgi:hypothetical protein